MNNQLTLAVAGSRKTQGIVEYCTKLPFSRKVLVVTYTQRNQAELARRISIYAGNHLGVEVRGWYSFLLKDFVKPFFPYMFQGMRVRGFNFEGRPHRMAIGIRRFLDSDNAAYGCELARLAHELINASNGKLLHRLECIYDEILIDEVQDLSSHDWEIIDLLLKSSINIRMVGDIRQSVLSTNPRSSKNKKYEYASVIEWFREREQLGLLRIKESNTTWRCNPDIALFSDSIFHPEWQFPHTISANADVTGHDGIFLIQPNHLNDYVTTFNPQCLRDSANSGKAYELNYLNFKVSKGATFERVLIVPTDNILRFITTGKYLEPKPAASFYVAITRAKQSVAIVSPNPDKNAFGLPIWTP